MRPCLVLLLLGTSCLDVDLEGRPCTSQNDCVKGYVCAGRICFAEDRRPTVDELLTSPLCHAVFPADAQDDLERGDAVVLASALPTSYAPSNGADRERAVALAAEEINEAGGIGGKPLAVLACDTANEADQATDVVRFASGFVGVDAIVGCASSTNTVAAFTDAARPAGTVMMSPSATSVRLTALPDDDLLWRTAPSDQDQGAALARFALSRGYQTVAVVQRDDAYGNGLEEVFFEALCTGGFTCVTGQTYLVERYAPDASSQDLRGILTQLATDSPDVVVVFGLIADASAVLTEALRNDNLAEADLLFSDGARQPALTDAVRTATDCGRVFGTGPLPLDRDDATSVYGRFVRRYEAKFDRDAGLFTAHAYDATYALAYGLAGRGEGTLPAALHRLASGTPVAVGASEFAGAQAELAGGGSIDLVGASGPVDFDAAGDVAGDIGLWRLVSSGTSCDIVDVGRLYDAATDTFDIPPL